MGDAGRFELSERRRLLLARLLRDEGAGAGGGEAIPRGDELGPAPLSFAQRRLWFFEQLAGGTAAYNLPAVVRASGPIDHAVLGGCLDAVIARHAALRTTFERHEGTLRQVVAPPAPAAIELHDLRHVAAGSRESRAASIVQSEIERPFDLATGPLVRAALVTLADDDHVVVLDMHHAVGDAWSWDLLLSEVAAHYEAAAGGRPPAVAPLPIQYTDFARWQLRRFEGGEFDEQLAHWRATLGGATPLVALPTDRPRPARPRFRGALVRFDVPGEELRALRGLGRAAGATLFMVTLAVFAVLVHRYSGQRDLVVGTPVAGRAHPEVEPLVGFFVDTLPLRVRVDGREPFAALLGRVRDTALDAFAHADVPFEQLLEELRPERGEALAYPQVMFAFRSAPGALRIGDVRLEPVPVHNRTSKRDLTVQLVDSGDRLEGQFEYDTDLYERATVERMAAAYGQLLRAVVDDRATAVSELPVVTPADERVVRERNATAVAFANASRCLHEIFSEQARATPEASAARHEERRLSYRELDRRSNQVARALLGMGVGPERAVGIAADRGLELAAGVLGILKAGGAFVPLDPSFPAARSRAILEDAGADVVVCEERWRGQFDTSGARLLALDAGWGAIAREDATSPGVAVDARNAAYVLYTSGSTGAPKGVVVEHRQIVNYAYAILGRLGIAAPAAYAMLQPLSVDSCLTMLVPPLLTGGEVHFVSRERALDARALAGYVREHAIDHLKIAPSHLAALQRTGGLAGIMPRRSLVVGGEASLHEWLRDVQATAPGCAVHNHYGPTETTVGVLTFAVAGDAGAGAGQRGADARVTPLGFPLANCQVRVLDRDLRPVPLGVPGELYVGGTCVARGYAGRPDLTAGAFLPDAFAEEPGGRLYATGDVARLRPGGAIEFVGRRDDQVKVRGFRVELGEIEHVLASHPGVADVLVVARAAERGEPRVTAYLVPAGGGGIERDAVAEFVAGRLPDHMVPADFVVLDALPLTPHGKVDHQALPAPREVRSDGPPAPGNALERELVAIWSRLLDVETVGVEDNFFDRGGHSLLVMELHDELQSASGRRFEVIELFRHTTVRAQARFLSHEPGGDTPTGVTEAQERGRRQSESMRRRKVALEVARERHDR
jgi:amino acid adenylation domain-containing protein